MIFKKNEPETVLESDSRPEAPRERKVELDSKRLGENVTVLDGDVLHTSAIEIRSKNPKIIMNGKARNGSASVMELDDKFLSTHLMILGGIGTGKSNTFYHMIDQLRKKMTNDDIVIIFDTKGDFLKFKKEGDTVISNDISEAIGPSGKDYWNIFNEVDPNNPEEHMREIARSIFAEKIDKSPNTYFPTAASDLFYAFMSIFYNNKDKTVMNNKSFINFLKTRSSNELFETLNKTPRLRYAANHISDPKSGQSQGVIAELLAVADSLFIGNFAEEGTLSMRTLVKEKSARAVFIEYDIKTGEVLTPIYSLLIDMCIKEALSRKRSEGSVYIFVDEFKLLPNLSHIDDAVNFGRSLGVRMIIGLQAITQIYDNYGEFRAKSILSGFLNNFFFRVNNFESRNFIKEYFGESVEKISYGSFTSGTGETVLERNVVKDKDITRLKIGEAIIATPNREPFFFRFDEYLEND